MADARLVTKHGEVLINFYPDVAPKTVASIKERISEGFYDGLTFHRVIDGFMAQCGDAESSGREGVDYTLKAEFSEMEHKRGILSMARLGHDIHSASTQFFICYEDQPHLDGEYTIFGEVESGMEAVDELVNGDEMVEFTLVEGDA
jgi:cyclophilin family peptidyl-prolyl cis-trans isomerase